MIDIRTNFERRKGWWIETRIPMPNALPPDGLLVCFRREDVEEFMDKTYPYRGKGSNKRWFFNRSFDREIAEIDVENRICANPSVLQYWLPRKNR